MLRMRLLLTSILLCIFALILPSPAWTDYDGRTEAFRQSDDATALKEWGPLAKQGDAAAQFLLGLMYANGRGVPQDDKMAVRWFRRAAKQGHAYAQCNLGWMYANGRGVPQDDEQAHMWFNLAAAQGIEEAGKSRDTLAALMTPTQIAEAQRLTREWKSKKQSRSSVAH